MSRISPDVIATVLERAGTGDTCELHDWCRTKDELLSPQAQVIEFHHRQARGMGGSTGRNQDTAANLLALHKACHMWVHAHPAIARGYGFIVSQYAATP